MTSKDPLLEKARKIENSAEQSSKVAADASKKQQNPFERLFESLLQKLHKAHKIISLFTLSLALIIKGLVEYCKWACFIRENGDFKRTNQGNLIFSGKKLIWSLLATFFLFALINLTLATLYFHGTHFEELVYTTGKQEIVTGELYQFTGCTSLPCSTAAGNGKFYQIEHSWFLPYLLYPEEDVYANIPQQDGACYAKGYGLYMKELKALHRRAQWYQKVYSISCRPYTEQEKIIAVQSGTVPKPPEIDK